MRFLFFTYSFLFITFIGNAQDLNVFDIARKGTLEQIEAAYKKNPQSINAVDERNSTPLILACYRGNTTVANYLAEKVNNVNYNTGRGTALMAAVMAGDLSIVNKLISVKADLNQKGEGNKTALIYAVFFNKEEIAEALIKAGADKNIQDEDGRKALDYANFNKNTKLIILLDQ
ncbi:ankyrin repeat domain-containing protein [Flavobacterium sp. CYK-55]|uniref:ankyrin repeat domain-containing protein n=1 Tax=Flavobacterium sp. CYK-55 TaxID=2835529 RepID=UPI001BCDD267|nr:ankyrin repeat domain-containing protein [Flavobacterium sp. CYK-55]MBS7786340.1 ankyrin repeat domain-containing protein [Flavobacterium sp. CYK-55]